MDWAMVSSSRLHRLCRTVNAPPMACNGLRISCAKKGKSFPRERNFLDWISRSAMRFVWALFMACIRSLDLMGLTRKSDAPALRRSTVVLSPPTAMAIMTGMVRSIPLRRFNTSLLSRSGSWWLRRTISGEVWEAFWIPSFPLWERIVLKPLRVKISAIFSAKALSASITKTFEFFLTILTLDNWSIYVAPVGHPWANGSSDSDWR